MREGVSRGASGTFMVVLAHLPENQEGTEGVTTYRKFSHFDILIWFSQIVINHPDEHPDNQ